MPLMTPSDPTGMFADEQILAMIAHVNIKNVMSYAAAFLLCPDDVPPITFYEEHRIPEELARLIGDFFMKKRYRPWRLLSRHEEAPLQRRCRWEVGRCNVNCWG